MPMLVGGGHTVNLLALWQAHGVDAAIRARYDDGDVVLAGVSAGGACWYAGCITDSFGDFRAWRGGLGLVPAAMARTTAPGCTTSTACPPTSSRRRQGSGSTASFLPTCPRPAASSWNRSR